MVPQEPHHDQCGYFTTLATAEIGVPPVELRNLAARGALRHVRRGVYRFEDARRTERDAFAEAVVRVGKDAYLTHDTVLAAQARFGGDEVPHRTCWWF